MTSTTIPSVLKPGSVRTGRHEWRQTLPPAGCCGAVGEKPMASWPGGPGEISPGHPAFMVARSSGCLQFTLGGHDGSEAMNASKPAPPYRRVAEQLRVEIMEGQLRPGESLPSEHELAQRHGVTRTTVRKAIALLRSDGLVLSEQGRATFVRPRPRVRLLSSGPNYRTRRASGMSNFNAEVAAHGQRPQQQLLEVSTIEAPSEIGARLGLPDDENLVVVRRRLFLIDDEPVQLCDGYYPLALVRGTPIEEERKIRGGVHAVLDDPAGPIRRTVARFVEDLEVRMPLPYEVELLRIPPGVPVARILRTTLDAHHEPIEVLDSVVPCDRHVFRYVIDVS